MKRRKREPDHSQESDPDPDLDPEIGSEAEAETDIIADVGIDPHPSLKTRRKPSAEDKNERNVVVAVRKETIVMIPVREKRPSMNAGETSTKIGQDQLRLPIRNARATGVAEIKTNTESGRERVIASTDHPTNTAQATALIVTIDLEVEIATEIEIESIAIAKVAADPKMLTLRPTK
jgi:hypothetical protein